MATALPMPLASPMPITNDGVYFIVGAVAAFIFVVAVIQTVIIYARKS